MKIPGSVLIVEGQNWTWNMCVIQRYKTKRVISWRSQITISRIFFSPVCSPLSAGWNENQHEITQLNSDLSLSLNWSGLPRQLWGREMTRPLIFIILRINLLDSKKSRKFFLFMSISWVQGRHLKESFSIEIFHLPHLWNWLFIKFTKYIFSFFIIVLKYQLFNLLVDVLFTLFHLIPWYFKFILQNQNMNLLMIISFW